MERDGNEEASQDKEDSQDEEQKEIEDDPTIIKRLISPKGNKYTGGNEEQC